ncbi:Sugar phosphate isomerase/epimerase [Spirosomataceae bacterium TFI 002]|nr:Sugar phosphate isomerase/epimerase [Spirosomataceae bacterium TFI 002]
MLRSSLLTIFVSIISLNAFCQESRNEFFTFLNMMDGDSISNTLEHKITYIQSVGYDGVGINLQDSFEEVNEILNDYDFRSSIAYMKVDMDAKDLDVSLKDYFKALKGSKAIVTPSFFSSSGKYSEVSDEGDNRVRELTIAIAQLARKGNLHVAIYPQYGYYVQSHNHASRLAREIAKLNIGYCFNLSQWLAFEGLEERNHLMSELLESISKLKVVTINGANKVITKKSNPWKDYILPLGDGSYDTFELLDYLINKLGYSGPIGIQCEGLTGDKMQLAEDTMLVWKSYLSQMRY